MSAEWVHEGIWQHEILLKNGDRIKPARMVLDSAYRVSREKLEPAVFVEQQLEADEGCTSMRWIAWDDIDTITSKMVREEA